ncbi:flagellin [Thermoanaerobacterium thermosaccharolyticum]|uniref:flagellin n=1 Tax=Thermoanaerobacterium thermosaccharolyticum TaxID=1517 RepID=UPI00178214DA|nr:flagellin [Thermoanaerobacterium thermosaccharolyticum]MBE0069866.1 flagellin [Thermoanaerobacterium thermosaccharolyticum]MBE0227469.1 flagellin [Thermoanaerobacterium thermosaccharolyticum]
MSLTSLLKKSKKGSAEIVAFAILLIFIVVAAGPKIKDLGDTVVNGVSSTNTQVQQTLGTH